MTNRRSYPRFTGPQREQPPGTWIRYDVDGDGFVIVTFKCPQCGQGGTLQRPPTDEDHPSHDISDDGVVTPSVVCPFTDTCSFHEHVILEGWEPPK